VRRQSEAATALWIETMNPKPEGCRGAPALTCDGFATPMRGKSLTCRCWSFLDTSGLRPEPSLRTVYG